MIVVRSASRERLRHLDGALGFSVICQDHCGKEKRVCRSRKSAEYFLGLRDTRLPLARQVQRPRQRLLAAKATRDRANGSAQQLYGFAESVPAVQDPRAAARIGQDRKAEPRNAPSCCSAERASRSKWNSTQASAGNRATACSLSSGMPSAARRTVAAAMRWRQITVNALQHGQLRKIDACRRQTCYPARSRAADGP